MGFFSPITSLDRSKDVLAAVRVGVQIYRAMGSSVSRDQTLEGPTKTQQITPGTITTTASSVPLIDEPRAPMEASIPTEPPPSYEYPAESSTANQSREVSANGADEFSPEPEASSSASRKDVYSLVKDPYDDPAGRQDNDYSLVKSSLSPSSSGEGSSSNAMTTRPFDPNSDDNPDPSEPPPDYGLPPRYNQIPMLDSLAKSTKAKRDRDINRRANNDGSKVNEANRLYRHACVDVSFGRAQFLRIPLPFPPIRLNCDGTVVVWSPETRTMISWEDGVGALEEKHCARKNEKSVFTAEEYVERVGGEENVELPYGGCTAKSQVGHFYDPNQPAPASYGRKADDVSIEGAYWSAGRRGHL